MPWDITTDAPGCDGFAVVKRGSGEVEGCHDTRTDAEDQLTALRIAEAEKSLLAVRGTKATQDEIDQRYEDFQDAVNMSASEVEAWGETECANEASQRPQEVRNRVIGLLRTPKDEWGDTEYEQAGRVISFISRVRGVEQGDPAAEGCPSDRDISLMNWAYDPTKSTRTHVMQSDLFAKGKHDYDTGDLVQWESSGGMARGRVIRVVTEGTVSPSTTDRTFEASEDDPRFLIQLVDEDGEGRTEDGEPVTVVHTADALSSPRMMDDDKMDDEKMEDGILRGDMPVDPDRPHEDGMDGIHEEMKRYGGLGELVIANGQKAHDLDDKGTFGGYLVHFGTPEEHDLENDFFTKETDYMLDDGMGSTHVFYGHGWDEEIGVRRITPKQATLTVKDAGVWMEMQMQARNEYEEMIMELARQGKLGLSSGTAAHLVTSQKQGNAFHVKTWPLGLDASLTPQPAEPRTMIRPVKSLQASVSLKALARQILAGDRTDESVMRELKAIESTLHQPRPPAHGGADASVSRELDSLLDTLKAHA